MQHHIQTLVKHFFHKETFRQVTVQELQGFADAHPYSAIGQLLFTQKLQETGAQNFREQAEKTSLYFHDPIWPGLLLKIIDHPTDDQSAIMDTPQEEPVIALNIGNLADHSAGIAAADIQEEVITETDIPVEEPPVNEIINTDNITEISVQENQPVPDQEEISEIPVTGDVPVVSETTIDNSAENIPGNMPAEEEAVHTEPVPEEIVTETSVAETAIPATGTEEPAATMETNTGSDLGTPFDKAIPGNNEITFEPFHTIDYFASQGIKLRAEDLSKDKLGKQLKSFTEWLRSMKRIAPVSGYDTP